jgi:uncharacterized protein (TIGR02453 family)
MFSQKSFKFLKDLSKNNNKEWFVSNKTNYHDFVLNPLKDIILDLENFIHLIDISLETKPVTNKAISTIYRDTRYSKNKLPLKTYIGFNFRKPRPDWKQFPALIFRINTSGYIFGLCIMKNNSDNFYNFRTNIDESEKEFSKIIKDINLDNDFELVGDNYKIFKYQGKNKVIKDFYSKKNLFLKVNRDKKHYSSKRDLILDIQETFQKLVPLYHYFDKVFTSD